MSETSQVDVEAPQRSIATPSRRWPESTPPPTLLVRPLSVVTARIQLQTRSSSYRFAKRAVDVVGSTVGLVVLAPVMLLVAVAIRLASKGPALFVQERCGLRGREFKFYKFRTMVVDAEARKADLEHLNEMQGPVFKIRKDPRVTPFGAFLRKASIDELPQLWNVLRGDMSLVGPRPPLPTEVEHYTDNQAQRLSIKPGITGLWQVSGRSDLVDFNRWVELDLEYARSCSLWLDLRILARTVAVVLRARGAQ